MYLYVKCRLDTVVTNPNCKTSRRNYRSTCHLSRLMPILEVDIEGLFHMPFGEATQNTVITMRRSYKEITDIMPNSLVANSVQLFITIQYFFLNALLSSMMLAREWDTYGVKAKG